MAVNGYLGELENWRAEMDAHLRVENGDLALAGLFWLRKGFNTFGSSPDCDIILPKPVPLLLGAYEFDGNNVSLRVNLGQSLMLNGAPFDSSACLYSDDTNPPSSVAYGLLRMVVIRRAHGVGIRIWDNARAERQTYPARCWFPPDPEYRTSAIYTPYPVPAKVIVPNALGEYQEDFMQGYVNFRLKGKSHRLEAAELPDGRLFIQCKDYTNSVKTFPAGRCLRTEPVSEDGELLLDFNRAYNPPPAFTKFATSTFAPRTNQVKIPIEAGELYEGHK